MGKINGFAEVIELEYVCSAFRAREIDFRRMNFCKILARKIFSETALNTLLNFEYSAFFGVSERYGTVVEIYVKVAYDLFFEMTTGGISAGVDSMSIS